MVGDMDYWCKTNEGFEVLVNVLVESICNEPLCSTLRVAKIYHLLSPSLIEDIVKVSRDIVLAHISVGEVPVSFI
jgi:hypothetical protein